MSAINYLAHQFVVLPQVFLFLPAIVIASVLFVSINRTKSQSFALNVPLGAAKTSIVHIVAGASLSFLAFILATLPSIIVCAIKNGIGRFDYPIVTFLPSGMWVGEITTFLAKCFVLVILGYLLLAALMLLVSKFVDNRMTLIIAAVALVLVSTSDSYFDPLKPMYQALKWLPATYFDIPSIIGDGDTYMMNAMPPTNSGIDFTTGIFVQLSAAVVLFALAMVVPIILHEIQKALSSKKAIQVE